MYSWIFLLIKHFLCLFQLLGSLSNCCWCSLSNKWQPGCLDSFLEYAKQWLLLTLVEPSCFFLCFYLEVSSFPNVRYNPNLLSLKNIRKLSLVVKLVQRTWSKMNVYWFQVKFLIGGCGPTGFHHWHMLSMPWLWMKCLLQGGCIHR